MDAYEATRIVFSRIQNLDPENAAKIMGIFLIQDHGEKEMIRLAFGPETLLLSVVVNARKELGLLPLSTPGTPTGAGTSTSTSVFSRQNSARLLPASPSAWGAPAQPFYRNASVNVAVVDDHSIPKELPALKPEAAPFYGRGDLIDELQIQEHIYFLNDGSGAQTEAKGREIFFPDISGECRSPGGGLDGQLLPSSMGWAPPNGHNHPLSSSFPDFCLDSDSSGVRLGWQPCLYFARGFCKNGNSCRFLHDEASVASVIAAGGVKTETAVEQEPLLMRSKSSRLMSSVTTFPYSPTPTVQPSPSSPSNKYMNYLLQHHCSSQRAAALMLIGSGGDDTNKFMIRPRLERPEFAGMLNQGSRQIYLTFPADCTFREEDVSNYFSIYGPVQDVRIPFQQKRMFGFVTFVYPETVKLILAKGNPHFVCDARVLVKPYKEKGKFPDKKQLAEGVDFSGNSTPFCSDSTLETSGRLFYGDSGQDASLLRRRLEEQQQAELLKDAIELQGRRFQHLDLKARNISSAPAAPGPCTNLLSSAIPSPSSNEVTCQKLSQQEDKSVIHGFSTEMPQEPQKSVNNAGDKNLQKS